MAGASAPTVVIGGLFAALALSCVFGGGGKPAAPVDPAKEKRFQSVVGGARWIKDGLKNPGSFELVSATMPDAETACYVFRGTNSFNAIVTQRRVISSTVNSGTDSAWHQYCEGRAGEDFTYARQAL